MKKIIATVLAMVMALALCTTAFAADPIGTVYNEDGEVIATATASLVAAKKPTATTAGNIAYYNVTDTAEQGVAGNYVVTDKLSADISVLTSKGKVYLETAEEVSYTVEATYVGQLQKKCVKLSNTIDEGKYYTAKDVDGDAFYFVANNQGDTVALVGTELVKFASADVATSLTKAHDFQPSKYDTDGITVTAYKCENCDILAKVVDFETYMAAKAADRAVVGNDYVVLSTASTTPAGTTSPKTFDAGIAMYVGMALTSVAGSAVVIGKKKEF